VERTTKVVELHPLQRQESACTKPSLSSSTDRPSEPSALPPALPSSLPTTTQVASSLLLDGTIIFHPNVTIMQRKKYIITNERLIKKK
jgi:hypothetical protein